MDAHELKIEVATCVRMLEHMGLMDFSGHVSARIPGTDHILINSWGASRCSLGPQDILRADLEGVPMDKTTQCPSEIHIHTAIYGQRADIQSVVHFHPPATTALSVAGKAFLPVIHHGAVFADGVPVYDDCRHVNTRERGDALAAVLGLGRAVIMRGHGAVVAAESVKGAFFGAVYLEDNAGKLLTAYSIGDPLGLGREELAIGERIWRQPQFEKVWHYYLEKSGIVFETM